MVVKDYVYAFLIDRHFIFRIDKPFFVYCVCYVYKVYMYICIRVIIIKLKVNKLYYFLFFLFYTGGI